MAEITQVISTVDEYTVTPSRNNPATFFDDRETRLSEETTRIPQQNTQASEINIWSTQANALATEVNSARDTAVASATSAENSATIANASANYKGDWISGYVGGYSLGDSVSYTDGYNYVSKINNNTVEPTSMTNTSEWNFIETIDPDNYYTKTEIDDDVIAPIVDGTTQVGDSAKLDGSTKEELVKEVIGLVVGYKNYIINGCFRVAQRGESFEGGNPKYTLDRWLVNQANISRVFTVNKYRVSISSIGSYSWFLQKIEDGWRLKGREVTFSFDLYNPIDMDTAYIYYTNAGGVGVSNTNIDFTTEGRKSVTFVVPEDGDTNSILEIKISLNDGSITGGSCEIANVQLEESQVATEFEKRAYGLELSLCQRYYWIGTVCQGYSSGTGGNLFNESGTFPVTMKAFPTITVVGAEYSNCSNHSLSATTHSLSHTAAITSSGNSRINALYTADAEI